MESVRKGVGKCRAQQFSVSENIFPCFSYFLSVRIGLISMIRMMLRIKMIMKMIEIMIWIMMIRI